MRALVASTSASLPSRPAPISEEQFADAAHAADLARHARSSRTAALYAAAWKVFLAWAEAQGEAALPCDPRLLARYVGHMSRRGLGPSSVDIALAAVADQHHERGLASPREDPLVRQVRRGFRRVHGVAPQRAKAVAPGLLLQLVSHGLGEGLAALRDRALILLGFAAALRRSELVAVQINDLDVVERGLILCVRRGKTDQEGEGRIVPVHRAATPALCPVLTVTAWLRELARHGHTRGALFVSLRGTGATEPGAPLSACGRDVSRILKRAATRAGVPVERLSGHSLRAGYATTAAGAGASRRDIRSVTGHRSDRMVEIYIRDGTLFSANPLRGAL